MSLSAIGGPPTGALGGRFFVIGYVPVCACFLFVLLLVWAGAPGAALDWDAAWRRVGTLGAGGAVLLVFATLVVALALHPLQLPLVRLLEGYWPSWCGALTRRGVRGQERRRQRLIRAAELPGDQPPAPAAVHVAGLADSALRARFPRQPHLLRPTRLGNALAAAEDRCGAPYGWDGPTAWPRLHAVLGGVAKETVEDRRDALDAACRVSVVSALCAAVSAVLLARTGWWLLLALAPLLLSALAYHAAVHAAPAYGQAVRVCFDLHRFDLYPALHLPLPDDPEQERRMNTDLSAFWRQGRALEAGYEHPEPAQERCCRGPCRGQPPDGAGRGDTR
ncbi:hypothetical protein GCM10011583_35100 [Streptomyces camponoticapitis]|uniref:Uncharacterized protein n=1 Tax=Streptomyces camponoticapitis TaxID=1616125 RepID=A0ABQ2ECV0_9ACTN|nr:hypothetical protein [Streptomyces camponoticapitis]GGK00620.1 hypothetical protein GCM10011583_35100 [Streptomyces camponoticapitis]